MGVIEGAVRDLLEKTEFVTIVTEGPDGPHVVGNWGDYLRRLGIEGDKLVLPAGYYRKTEENLRSNPRVQILAASRSVEGSHGPGQGCLLHGTGAIVNDPELLERVKASFPWARAVLVIEVGRAELQL
ncbi:pyridoxamine 5'-phosphate oxidase family protein [Aromatoleum toluclasticum]|uniref:pyridoxamine 5'-phosphate oxidase family protein n=1 Tax=Aromatoleum toluclasticum TaxID=92003 RepID=UPI00036A8E03|nr:pyridoxamine 5'-phosphate oxidase family protein [Aromatoleum toluclasticum]MCC4116095.1 pyridoxamine 5'-phosphate oxidase family protein [Aromatoleum toluclasticum]